MIDVYSQEDSEYTPYGESCEATLGCSLEFSCECASQIAISGPEGLECAECGASIT